MGVEEYFAAGHPNPDAKENPRLPYELRYPGLFEAAPKTTNYPAEIGAQLGGAVGGAVGGLAGPVGTAAGSLVGSSLGGHVADSVSDATARAFFPSMADEPEHRFDPAAVLETAKANAPFALAQIAFHGSPHNFERFATEHVGTGEGHGAFGHGLYFAENPQVAEGYRQRLARNAMPIVTENERALSAAEVRARYFTPGSTVAGYGGHDKVLAYDPGDASRGWSVRVQGVNQAGEPLPGIEGRQRVHATEPNPHELAAALEKRGLGVSRGRTYAADVPENDTLLDYDRPLSAQPPKVRDALANSGLVPQYTNDPRGDLIYEALSHRLGSPAAASKALGQVGIPGLRYLDQGSRTPGQGTHNFVIWDEGQIAGLGKAPTLEELKRMPGVAKYFEAH